jgi:hypothetical protein
MPVGVSPQRPTLQELIRAMGVLAETHSGLPLLLAVAFERHHIYADQPSNDLSPLYRLMISVKSMENCR